MPLAEAFNYPRTKWVAGSLVLMSVGHLSQDILAWKKLSSNPPNQDWLQCCQEVLEVCYFCLPAPDPLQRPTVVPLQWSHGRVSPLESCWLQHCPERCSGPIRAVSFPEDKRYAEGKKPNSPRQPRWGGGYTGLQWGPPTVVFLILHATNLDVDFPLCSSNIFPL